MQIGDLVRYKPKFISELPEENAGNVGIIVVFLWLLHNALVCQPDFLVVSARNSVA